MDKHSFLFQAIIFLSAAVLFVPVAKKLGLGSVLGYLLAGVVIGPFVLSLISEEREDIMHFAEYGVVLMLFLIGLELEPEMLWKLRKSIIGLGALQLLLTTFFITALARLFGFGWDHSIVLGMILSLSSTAIVFQILAEKGLMKESSGRSAFAVLLFQDIAVIPMLAILPLFSSLSNSDSAGVAAENTNWMNGMAGWLRGLIVLGSIVSIIVVGRLVIRPVLRIVAKTDMREIFTAVSLLIVIGIAALMLQVGLSPALGAFLAGVVLANSEYRHELESDIEPFKGLLLGLFFISVGASIDFQFIASQIWTVLAWVCLLIIIKTLVLLLLGKVFKIEARQNFIFAFSLSQVGEFAFVLLSFTLQQKILPEAIVNLMIAIVAISMAITPILMLLNERLILPRFAKPIPPARAADVIDEKNKVIIAGFGHFGSTVGRFLRANKVNATYLDLDSDRVEVLRRMGLKVFYGDASRLDLLKAAGAKEASIIVIAIDDAAKRLEMVSTIKKHFPHLHMLVRCRNRYDAYEQMNAGLLHIYRETLDTSVRVGVDAMSILGFRKYTALRLAKTFIKQDELNLKKLAAIRDREEYITEVKKYIEELESIMQGDNQYSGNAITGWNAKKMQEDLPN